ncbi:MAG: hypothetical protein U0441_18160 [Polyangiaceae bacterium]
MGEPYRETLERDDEPDDVAVVAQYSSTLEAEMAREFLGSHGIRAHASDSARFNPLVNIAAGGSRLLVAGKDESRARHLLSRMEKTPANTAEDDADERDIRCPRCELTYCFHESTMSYEDQRTALVSPFLSMFLLPFRLRKKRWHCHKCLYVWDDPEEGPKRATPLAPDDPKPVFRLRGHAGGAGLFVGVLGMFLMWGVAAGLRAGAFSSVVAALGLLAPFVGLFIGRGMVSEVCSAPHCRAPLTGAEEECPQCHGFIAGVIRFSHEHYSESARFRRELREMESPPKKRLNPKARRPRSAPEGSAPEGSAPEAPAAVLKGGR